jgi:hypothetical protein
VDNPVDAGQIRPPGHPGQRAEEAREASWEGGKAEAPAEVPGEDRAASRAARPRRPAQAPAEDRAASRAARPRLPAQAPGEDRAASRAERPRLPAQAPGEDRAASRAERPRLLAQAPGEDRAASEGAEAVPPEEGRAGGNRERAESADQNGEGTYLESPCALCRRLCSLPVVTG